MENFYTPLDNKTIKLNARQFIRGRLWLFWSLLIVVALIETVLNYIPQILFGGKLNALQGYITGNPDAIPKEINFGAIGWYYAISALITIILIPLNIGVAQNVLAWTRGENVNKWKVLFGGFSSAKTYFKQVGTTVLCYILCALWAILLIVPGIIKAIGYSFYPFIMRDEPDLSVWQTLKKSDEMLKGYKGKLVLMYLSFIGWFIVGAFTFGILYVWLTPYVMTSKTMFYDEVRRSFYNGSDPARTAFGDSGEEFTIDDNPTL